MTKTNFIHKMTGTYQGEYVPVIFVEVNNIYN